MHFSSYISLQAFLLSTIRVRSFLRCFFLACAITRLLRQRVPVRGPWIGRTGALNKVAIKRVKSYAADCMPSQGLGPRRSVLPLLISFLFSHIVLAELSFPLRFLALLSSSFLRPYSLSSHHSFPSSFFFSSFLSVSPSHLSSRFLFIFRLWLISAPWESARAILAAREEVLIPVSLAHHLSRLRDRFERRLVAGSTCWFYRCRVLLSSYTCKISCPILVRWISHEADSCIRFKKSI